jgi:hypothetical protein
MSQMFLNVVSTFKGDGLAAATRQLGAFGNAAGGLGSTLGKVGAALASFGLATKAVQFTKNTIDEAKNLQQNLFALELVFEDLAPRMQDFAKNAANIGLSQAEAAKASVFLGSVMKQSGFAITDVADKTETLIALATDLSLVYQYPVSEALMGMTALFRGEYDPIEKFGVAMKQSEVNAALTAKKLNHLTGEQRRLAEQTIRYDLLMQRATDSVGAFAKSSGNLAAESLKLNAEFKNMQSSVGTALVPSITDLVVALKPLVDELTPRLLKVLEDAKPAIGNFTQFIKDLGDQSTTTGTTASFLADTVGTFFRILSENFGVLVQATILIGAFRVAFLLLNAAMLATPTGWLIFGLAGAATGLLLVADAAKKAETSVYNLNVEVLKSDPVKQVVAPYRVYEGILGDLSNSTAVMSEQTRQMIADVERADKAKLDNLKQQFINTKISAAEAANEIRRMTEQAGISAGGAPAAGAGAGAAASTTGGGGAKKKPAPSGLAALAADAKKSTAVVKKQGALQRAGLSKTVARWITSTGKPIKAANQALKLISKNGAKGVKSLNSLYKKSSAGRAAAARAAEAADQAASQAAAERARKEAERIAEQKRVYQSFLDSVSSTFAGIKNAIMSAFDITDLGSSTNSIIRNLNKLLNKTRDFAANISKLSSMGLDPALLQQVISAGPMAGARLAAALVQGGVGALSQINAAYGEFGNLAGQIATTGTNALFGTQAQQNVYNINVNGGVGSGATIGQAIVEAIKAYERVSGAVWQGA